MTRRHGWHRSESATPELAIYYLGGADGTRADAVVTRDRTRYNAPWVLYDYRSRRGTTHARYRDAKAEIEWHDVARAVHEPEGEAPARERVIIAARLADARHAPIARRLPRKWWQRLLRRPTLWAPLFLPAWDALSIERPTYAGYGYNL